MRAKSIFRWSGIYGMVVLTPLYFMEDLVGRQTPPAITHPEYFYGFIGVALAWQIVFLIISGDPPRYRPLMIPAMLEKLTFGVASIVLLAMGRMALTTFCGAVMDLVWLCLFMWSYRQTPTPPISR